MTVCRSRKALKYCDLIQHSTRNKNLTKFSKGSVLNTKGLALLLIGPLPPPIGGGSVTFKLFCDKVREHAEVRDISIINSSASYFKPRSQIFAAESAIRGLRIVYELVQKVYSVDEVFIFGTNGFVTAFTPFLLPILKITGVKCHIRVFGGSLDRYHRALPLPFRCLLTFVLSHINTLIVQTSNLHEYFTALIGSNVCTMRQYRESHQTPDGFKRLSTSTTELRMVFLGHVKRTKGIFILLESIDSLRAFPFHVNCDFYGPISKEDEEEFLTLLKNTRGVGYKGIVDTRNVVSMLSEYDVLVLPTFYPNEGEPGVIVEAMMAGIPVIASNFQSIPDLVEDGINGLLIEPENSSDLTKAIAKLHWDRELLNRLAINNHERRKSFDINFIVVNLLKKLEIPVKSESYVLLRDKS